MSESEPTLGEVVRQLDRVAGQLTTLASRLDSDRLAAQQTFVNRETYQSDQRLTDALLKSVRTDITELENARKTEDKWRRQQSFTLAVTLGNSLIAVALTIFTVVSR